MLVFPSETSDRFTSVPFVSYLCNSRLTEKHHVFHLLPSLLLSQVGSIASSDGESVFLFGNVWLLLPYVFLIYSLINWFICMIMHNILSTLLVLRRGRYFVQIASEMKGIYSI